LSTLPYVPPEPTLLPDGWAACRRVNGEIVWVRTEEVAKKLDISGLIHPRDPASLFRPEDLP